jgi:2-methylcitrate dehydratase PrpD
MSEAADPSKITANLGSEFKITENSFKIHASCRHTHPAIDCVLDIMNKHAISYQDIKKITVHTYQTVLNITDNPNPGTVYAAKFSSQFCAGLAAVKGSASLRDFSVESLRDPEIIKLIGKVEVLMDSYYEEGYPEKWGAKVEVELEDGRVFSEATDYPKGDPEKMASKEELIQKFISMTADKLENPLEDVEAIFKLDQISTREWFSRKVIGV